MAFFVIEDQKERRKEMLGIFKKAKSGKGMKKAVVFVDYEHWYISLDRLHKEKPNIKAWRDALMEQYEIQEIYFFADFSNPAIKKEIPKIREVSNFIIETQNTSSAHKKDFTDFIMLDHIYQKAINSPDTDAFILFSGDGHFSSVTNYLISKLGKEVGIFAIRGALSNQLKNTASRTELLPKNEDPDTEGYKLILSSLRALRDDRLKKSYPTFFGTINAVSRQNHLPRREVSALLRKLMAKDCIKQTQTEVDGKKIKTISVDWKKCRILGFWD